MKKILLILIISIAAFLRLYNLGINPPSLYWDEASLGYNAYSILASGADEHGEFYPLDRFVAFGDYKPPGYIYAAVPSIAFFGLNEFAVRFPSALSGILMVILTYLIARKLFKGYKVSLAASLFMAVSPWSIHLSRGAFEANLAALFNLAALYLFLLGTKKGYLLILSLFFFILSFYTFNANRIIAPLMYVALCVIYYRESLKNIKWLLFGLLMAVLLLLPSMQFLMSKESKLRFQEVSIFNNVQPVILANQRQSRDGSTIMSKIIHNRRILFTADLLKHFTENFKFRFLFTHGDVNPRLSVQGMGQLFFMDLPFIFIGLWFLIFKRPDISLFIFVWMAISVIPAGTAKETPHALRIVSILPSFQLISAFGLFQFQKWLKKSFLGKPQQLIGILFVVCFLLVTNIYYYLHLYHVHFPVENSGQYQYGTKEMVGYVTGAQINYNHIFVTPEIGRPYIFFAFYMPVAPVQFQAQKVVNRDWLGFWDVKSLGKIEFNLNNINNYSGRLLLISNNQSLPGSFRLIKIIRDLEGKPVFYISHKI